jgi:hypothetical protein
MSFRLSVLSCPELLNARATPAKVGRKTLVQVLTDIETLARFRQSPLMPHAVWWHRQIP